MSPPHRPVEDGTRHHVFFAGPVSAENVLRWGNANDAFTLDPHSFDHTHTDELQQQIYETLVGIDSDMSVSGISLWRGSR